MTASLSTRGYKEVAVFSEGCVLDASEVSAASLIPGPATQRREMIKYFILQSLFRVSQTIKASH